MAASCHSCGGVVRCDREAVVLAGDGWYAHCTGTCPDCGNTVQWHRAIAGRLGSGYLYSMSPRRCWPSCAYHDQGAGLPDQV
jgi:hypothetical protein